MRIFLAAVDAGSLSEASRTMGMPLATVSRKVSDLETHLRTQLLLRTSRRLSLTEAGSAYVTACRRILGDIDEAERTASGEYRTPSGALTITAPVVFGRMHVEPVVLDFLREYPRITIRLVLADRMMSLVDEHIDLAVRIGHLPDSSLMATRLTSVTWVTCASPAYFEARGMPLVPDNLRGHDCVAFEGLHAPYAWTFRNRNETRTVAINPRLVVNTAEAAIDAATAGAGITRLLSYQVAAPVRQGRLVLTLREFEPEPLPVSLVYAAQPLLPLKLRAFVDFAAPRLKAALA